MAFKFKKLLKARVISWAATTALLTAVLITANILCSDTLKSLIDSALGGDPAIIDPESKNKILQEFNHDPSITNKEAAFDNGNSVVRQICEEGMVLLKNEGNFLPLNAASTKISVFGKNSVNLVYGGSGSAAPGAGATGKYGARKTIFDSLTEAGFSYNETLKSFYESSASGSGRDKNPAMENAGVSTLKTGETPYESYTDAVKSTYDTYNTALVVFSRIAGENWDLPRAAADNDPGESRHYLNLDKNERRLLKELGESGKFQHIIVLMNGSNYIDLGFLKAETNPADYNEFGKYVDGAIVIGSPGAEGIMALGKILSGAVNPSGHTVDTVYTKYSEDPTWQNFGGNFQKNGDAYLTKSGTLPRTPYFFVEYEENIYMGYRYYETRGHVEGEAWYNQNVVYPFGYGLSYATFTQELLNKSALEAAALNANETFDVQIKVTNNSTQDVAGKQVVQLYAEAPYTNGGIEKSYKVLVGFAKTKLLAKGESETVTITVNPYDFASFDSQDKNNNNFKGYELDAGDYVFHAGTDAHNDFATFTKNLPAPGAKFEKDPVTNNDVEVLFPEMTSAMNPAESLSRSNFAGTMPKLVTDEERKKDDAFFAKLSSFETTNDEVYDKLPKMGANNGVQFTDLVGKAYDDPLWDSFLDQMLFGEMLKLFNDGLYHTTPIERLGIARTTSADGPTGIVAFSGDPAVYNTCYYQSECLLAQTYNVELAEKEGLAIGEECLIGNEKGDKLSYPGWYAPGVNLHRSPFSGRNTEYYSEDPFLSGKMAAKIITSVQSKGVYVNIKHFALNDQETHRSKNGIATWCDEQAMRELYLKPFEIAIKEGKARGLMTSFNRIGTEWAGGSYRLLTKVLREEWGFRGSVICDYHTDTYMDSKQMLYAGGDLNLCGNAGLWLQTSRRYRTDPVSPRNAKDAHLLRKAAHNNLYALVNSNGRVDVLGYKTAGWRLGLYIGTGVAAGALAVWGFFAIFTALRKKDKAAPQAE